MEPTRRVKSNYSRALTQVLRHKALEWGIAVDDEGYALVDHLLEKVGRLKGLTIPLLQEIVDTCKKNRFTLKTEDGRLYIRANQGHTLKHLKDDAMLETITDASTVPFCIHGTYYNVWDLIRTQGLKRMGRRHVHFAAGETMQGDVRSGFRTDCEILVYIDVPKLLSSGLKLYRSSNNVLLCPGLEPDGVVPPEVFSKVIDRRTGKNILEAAMMEEVKGEEKEEATGKEEDSIGAVGGDPADDDPWEHQWVDKVGDDGKAGLRTANGKRYLAVLDFEATCVNKGKLEPQEIIEFPTVVLDLYTMAVVGEWRRFVRPVHHPQLTEFCKELTGIKQAQVDAAKDFPAVLEEYVAWMSTNGFKDDCVLVTCGQWDVKSMLVRQCETSKIPIPSFMREWVNIKFVFQQVMKAKPEGMPGMLRTLNLKLIGKHHSGLHDCRNICRIAEALIDRSGGQHFNPIRQGGILRSDGNGAKRAKPAKPRKPNGRGARVQHL